MFAATKILRACVIAMMMCFATGLIFAWLKLPTVTTAASTPLNSPNTPAVVAGAKTDTTAEPAIPAAVTAPVTDGEVEYAGIEYPDEPAREHKQIIEPAVLPPVAEEATKRRVGFDPLAAERAPEFLSKQIPRRSAILRAPNSANLGGPVVSPETKN
jgi:hypothetical protein